MIDIGAVFPANPRDHKKFAFEPLQREFLIDIDLTDYEFLDQEDRHVQEKGPSHLRLACCIVSSRTTLDSTTCFSCTAGRRGIHCRGCDTRARLMSNDVRWASPTT